MSARGAGEPAMKPVKDAAGRFTFSVPADWSVQQIGAFQVAWDSQQQMNASAAATPKQYATLDEYGAGMRAELKRQVAGWAEEKSDTIHRGGTACLVIRANSTPKGVATYTVYYLSLIGEHQLLFSVACPSHLLAARRATFDRIAASWRPGGSRAAPPPIPPAIPAGPPPKAPSAKSPAAKTVAPATVELRDKKGRFSLRVPRGWKISVQDHFVRASFGEGAEARQVVASFSEAKREEILSVPLPSTKDFIPGFEHAEADFGMAAWYWEGYGYASKLKERTKVRLAGRDAVRYVAAFSHDKKDDHFVEEYCYVDIRAGLLCVTSKCSAEKHAAYQPSLRAIVASLRIHEGGTSAPATPAVPEPKLTPKQPNPRSP
jgi:hypothetical protein